MRKFLFFLAAIAVSGLVSPPNCPAPLVWRKGEGWSWEREGVTTGKTPAEQLKAAKDLQAKKKYGDAAAAYRRLIRRWPTSSAAQDARLGLAECLVARQYYWKAFKEYQQLIEKHPNTPYFDAVLQREFEIANLFAAGERQRVWGVRFFPTPEKAIEIYNQIVKNGPYSAIAPESQLRIGLVYEKQKDYLSAVHAYEKLLERYPNDPHAEAAQFQIGYAYKQESARAEYDQDLANKSIAAFQDFLVRFPNSDKVPAANEYLASMKAEQSKGLFLVAKFYEKRKNYKAALIYYNEVIAQNPQSDWANQAKEKVAKLAPQIPEPTANP